MFGFAPYKGRLWIHCRLKDSDWHFGLQRPWRLVLSLTCHFCTSLASFLLYRPYSSTHWDACATLMKKKIQVKSTDAPSRKEISGNAINSDCAWVHLEIALFAACQVLPLQEVSHCRPSIEFLDCLPETNENWETSLSPLGLWKV